MSILSDICIDVTLHKKLNDEQVKLVRHAYLSKICVKIFYIPADNRDKPRNLFLSIKQVFKADDGYYIHAYSHTDCRFLTFSLSRIQSIALAKEYSFFAGISPEMSLNLKLSFVPDSLLHENKRNALLFERRVKQKLVLQCTQLTAFFIKRQLKKQGWLLESEQPIELESSHVVYEA